MNIIEEYNKRLIETRERYGLKSVVLMMIGGFYEMYTDNNRDSVVAIAAKLLDIRITKKNGNNEMDSIKNPYMCGVPVHSIGKHITRLLQDNFTIAVYDQFDSESLKTTKKERKLVKVLSPGTDIEYTERVSNVGILGIYVDKFHCPLRVVDKMNIYFTYMDLSTGKCKIHNIVDNSNDSKL